MYDMIQAINCLNLVRSQNRHLFTWTGLLWHDSQVQYKGKTWRFWLRRLSLSI